MMLLGVTLLFGHLIATYAEDTPFKCVDTDEDCPSKMCFYSIDNKERCYRAGCAEKELCHGRRNNECFMSDTLHTCCCFEAGCAAGYKGLNDCVDEPKNATEAVTSVTDVTTTTFTTDDISTNAPTKPQNQRSSSTTTKPPATSTSGISTSTSNKLAGVKTEKSSTVGILTTTAKATSTTTEGRISSSSPSQKSTRSETQSSPIATSSTASATEKQPLTTAKVTPRIQTVSTLAAATRTTRYSTPTTTTTSTTPTTRTSSTTTVRTTPSTTTTTSTTTTSTVPSTSTTTTSTTTTTTSTLDRKTPVPLEELRPLPDLSHSEYTARPTLGRRPIEVATTTTRSAKSHAKARVESFAEQRDGTESGGIFSPAMTDDQQSKNKGSSAKKGGSSLISVYEVTTQAVKNREAQEEWKAPVPWWSAVVFGFIVAVIAAWVVVFILKKKRARETVESKRGTEKEQGLVDPLLRTSEENSRLSDNSRI